MNANMRTLLRFPSYPEVTLHSIIVDLNLPFDYVGDGATRIGSHVPDWIHSRGEKLAIEMDGKYWHPSKRDIERDINYRNHGWLYLIITDEDMKNTDTVVSKLLAFLRRWLFE